MDRHGKNNHLSVKNEIKKVYFAKKKAAWPSRPPGTASEALYLALYKPPQSIILGDK